jgi:hypothetical protein
VPDQEHPTSLRADVGEGRRDIACEGNRGVLDDADVVTMAAQDSIDALPAGAVDKAAVNENDVEWTCGDDGRLAKERVNDVRKRSARKAGMPYTS